MGKALTSKEIAKQAGVSVSTVSIVLNQKTGVSEETRAKILNIFDENGIRLKNSTSRTSNKNRVILFCKISTCGTVINERHNIFISEYSDAIIEESNRLGYSVTVSNYNQVPVESIVKEIENTVDISGCILLATEFSLKDVIAFNSLSVPHVYLDAIFHRVSGRFVSMDNNGMVFSMISYLKDHGHAKIGMFMNEDASNFVMRSHAFLRSMQELGLKYEEKYVFSIRSTYKEAYQDVLAILRKGKREGKREDLPTTFFACSDIMAIGAIRAFKEFGIKVPEEISIVGFDNLPLSSIVEPGLTTMDVPKAAIGRYSVNMLLDMSTGSEKRLPDRCVFAGTIVERSSVRLVK